MLAHSQKFQRESTDHNITIPRKSPLNNFIQHEKAKASTPKPSGIIRKNQSIFEVIDINDDDDQDEDDSVDYSLRAANLLLRAAIPKS